ncbi:MAG: macro domain-containing protein [Acidobacteriota bacterium]|nr:MAG: macro domain-containing protein [Acidobacteriota bacterium]
MPEGSGILAAGAVELIRGDITLLAVDAFIYYAHPNLSLGAGFGTAISVRGGPAIKEQLDGSGPLATGRVIVTTAGALPAKAIIHAVGPRFQEPELESKLANTIYSALKEAESRGFESLAFPPMGTGFYGIPLDVCARVMIPEITTFLSETRVLKRVVICVADAHEEKAFRECIQAGKGE